METATISVQINGEARELPAGLSLLDLLRHLGVPEKRVAVEYNRKIVKPPEWESTAVHSGDEIEVVHFVGGGR